MNEEEKEDIIDCPLCGRKLFPKKVESYKCFYLCINPDCSAISIIITTTIK